ncbi:hypothetical protein C0992_011577 [Termitomyces sp. T32_za158]|nr:hypothetical protein C0992_011577 [Termitomyces sp. T32_za158]
MPPITTNESQEQSTSTTSSILKERRFKLSRRTATLEDRMHHLETLIQAIPPAVFAAGGILPSNVGQQPLTESATSPVLPFAYPTQFPSGVPPPSLHVFPLTNPSTHFTRDSSANGERHHGPSSSLDSNHKMTPDQLAEEASHMSLTASYLYFDDEGYTRWQGETSGLPVLDLLVERHTPSSHQEKLAPALDKSQSSKHDNATNTDWFPDRKPRRADPNPQTLWRLMTSYIVPELMDRLKTLFFLLSVYQDYGNPEKWGEAGFASFIVAVCCLASRHIDDPRVRANPSDGISSGTHWFELFGRLRNLPIADRPTLYNIQANLIAAVYAVGLGKLSKAAALLAEAVTMSIDAGLHRCADDYDVFDPIEDELRKRTFWCVYIWDKQLSAHFGRPPLLRLRDCDVSEPAPVDDEYITRESVGTPPPGTDCRLTAFICSLRIMVVLESVLDVPPVRNYGDSSSFLLRATHVLSGSRRFRDLRDEETLLDDIHRSIPPYWQHTPETLASEDIIRLTQAERLHCAEHFVRLLIYRHRFSELMAERTNGGSDEPAGEQEKAALIAAQKSALQIITTHLQVAKKGLMTYLTQIPLETHRREPNANNRPPWIRPVRKKSAARSVGTANTDSPPQHSSPEGFSPADFFVDPPKNGSSSLFVSTPPAPAVSSPVSQQRPQPFSPVNQPQAPFMDTSGMGFDMIREDSHMYMSASDMMGLFDDGVDVQQLFGGAFLAQQPQSQSRPSQLQGSSTMNMDAESFDSPGFMKQSLTTTP